MQAMVLKKIGDPLEWTDFPDPQPGPGQIRLKVGACGVCRTDLHVVDGELPNPVVAIIPGHEIVGRIDAIGEGVKELILGQRVSPRTLERWRWEGFGPRFLKIGGRILYRLEDIEAYEQSSLRQETLKDDGVPLEEAA